MYAVSNDSHSKAMFHQLNSILCVISVFVFFVQCVYWPWAGTWFLFTMWMVYSRKCRVLSNKHSFKTRILAGRICNLTVIDGNNSEKWVFIFRARFQCYRITKEENAGGFFALYGKRNQYSSDPARFTLWTKLWIVTTTADSLRCDKFKNCLLLFLLIFHSFRMVMIILM